MASSDQIRNLIIQESKGYDPHSPTKVPKRTNYLPWDDYFLAVAYLSGKRSKDPMNSKGACIVDTQGRIVGIGYDGFPRGCSDDCLPWASSDLTENNADNGIGVEGDENAEHVLPWLHTREPYLCHAEINAILNKCSNDVVGGRMFVPDFPCKCISLLPRFLSLLNVSDVIYSMPSKQMNAPNSLSNQVYMKSYTSRKAVRIPILHEPAASYLKWLGLK